MGFKFEGNQKVFVTTNGHPVTILGRSEFFNGKQNRYYIKSDTAIPDKNHNEDWINEDKLTTMMITAAPAKKPTEPAKATQGKKVRET